MIGSSRGMNARTPSCCKGTTEALRQKVLPAGGRKPMSVTAYRLDSKGKKSMISGTESAADDFKVLQQQLGRPVESSVAWVATAPKQPLEKINLVQDQPLKANEVDIAVTHNGVCHSGM
eukprot:1108543-Pelagomonas_calceolata.AAC.2